MRFYTESRNVYVLCAYIYKTGRKKNPIRLVNEMCCLPLDLIWKPNSSPVTVAMALAAFSVENCLPLELQDALASVAKYYYWATDYPEVAH